MGIDPVTLAIGSAVMGGIGSIQQGQAASSAANYNAKIQQNNAAIATQNADFAGAQGNVNVAAQGAKNKAQVGATLASQGASGVTVNTGSPVAVRESEAKVGMLDALNIRAQAAQKAYGYQVEAVNDKAQADLEKSKAKAARTAGYIGAATSVLGGAAQASEYSNLLGVKDPTGGITGHTINYGSEASN